MKLTRRQFMRLAAGAAVAILPIARALPTIAEGAQTQGVSRTGKGAGLMREVLTYRRDINATVATWDITDGEIQWQLNQVLYVQTDDEIERSRSTARAMFLRDIKSEGVSVGSLVRPPSVRDTVPEGAMPGLISERYVSL